MQIRIGDSSGWQELKRQGLQTVMDPMVVRCGELFLRGASQATDQSKVWDLLQKNMHALGMFFDRLVIDEKLPIFNYGDTFDMRLNFDQRIWSRFNDYEPVLHDVNVEFGPYRQIKDAALAELAKVYGAKQQLPPIMESDILAELSAAEYDWSPSLESLGTDLTSDNERKIAAFLLGGLIFGGYAQQMSSEHLVQPKRSRLFLAISLGAETVGRKVEDALFADLKARAQVRTEDLPWTPTFFPYLLGRVKTPTDLIAAVVELRRSREVRDYRHWLREVLQDFKDGKVTNKKRQDIEAIAKAVDRKLGKIPSVPQLEVKTTIAAAVAGMLPISVNLTPTLQALWGWLLPGIPGYGYRKLLTRAVLADREYIALEERIRTVWTAT